MPLQALEQVDLVAIGQAGERVARGIQAGRGVDACQRAAALPALAAGANTIGNVGINNNPVGASSLATGQAAMSSTASLIVAARAGAVGAGAVSRTLFNAGNYTVYLGGPGVTAATGFPLLANASFTVTTTAPIYGICSAGLSSTIGIWETF